MGTPSVLAFDEPLPPGVDPSAILGGKAAGLAVMARDLALPVPPGFVVTTDVCRRFLANGWDESLESEIAAQLERLAERSGRRFGDPQHPLLVSVRSGAPVSMPGMMDTLLNVGMTPAIRERLALESGSAEFAADTWLRFNRMYAEIVLDLPREATARATGHDGTAEGAIAAARRLRELAAPAGGIPEDPLAQLLGAIKTVFRSWDSGRARVFRAKEGISAGLGTAATIQAMVFGNLDEASGTGVAFTRDPSTGEATPCGDYLPRAQGEDVVAGTHRVQGLDALASQLPAVHAELLQVMERLEHHYRDMCDIEFTVSTGKLYLLQTRVGRRSPLAAVRIAVQMAADPGFPLSQREAVARVGEETFRELANLGVVAPGSTPIATGLAASPGVGVGLLCCDADRAAELGAAGTAIVLARPETSPSDVHGMIASAGIVTSLGGVVSHAAVVARGWAIPAVCSLSGAEMLSNGIRLGSEFIPEGTLVTICGSSGALFLGDCRGAASPEIPELLTLRRWAAEADEDAAITHARVTPHTVSAFEALRTLQLKGLCTFERIAQVLGSSEEAVATAMAPHEALLKPTARGYALTAEGRALVSELLETERAACDSAALEAAWSQFVPLNHRFKILITDAQQASAIDSTSVLWPPLLESLCALDADFSPLVSQIGAAASRLAAYRARFAAAITACRAGDHTMFASPLKDSYHTVWFEFHEELFALTGRDRATEEAAASH